MTLLLVLRGLVGLRLTALVVLVCVHARFVQSVEECGVLKDEHNPPWNVGLYREVRGSHLELVCLGTAIERNVIVTAALCLCDQSGKVKNEQFYVSSNKLDKYIKDSRNLHKIEKPNISVHSQFGGDIKRGNVAILKLQTNIKNEGFSPICIDWENNTPLLIDGEILRHPTWQNDRIKMTDVSYVDDEQCRQLASKSLKALLTRDKICARSIKEFSGDIDAGSGLIYLNFPDNKWYMRGVVCVHDPEENSFITYSDIVLYLNWLSSVAAKQ